MACGNLVSYALWCGSYYMTHQAFQGISTLFSVNAQLDFSFYVPQSIFVKHEAPKLQNDYKIILCPVDISNIH